MPYRKRRESSRKCIVQDLGRGGKEHILNVLASKNGHLGEVCQTLGISRPTLRTKLRLYDYE